MHVIDVYGRGLLVRKLETTETTETRMLVVSELKHF